MVKLKPAKFYKDKIFTFNESIQAEALLMQIGSSDMEQQEVHISIDSNLTKQLFQKKSTSESHKKSKPHRNNDPSYEMELDLHIEELLKNYKGMSNAEIIQVQLRHFQINLDIAINEHYRKLIVIHGVGNGRLKQEVHKILSTYKNLQYFDASYSKYGYGATEIQFRL